METAVVEELATKMDQQAAIKRDKEQCMDQFRRSLRQLDQRCADHLHALADDFSRTWLGVAERIGQVTGPLHREARDSPKRQAKTVWAASVEPASPPKVKDARDEEVQDASPPRMELAATPSSRTGHTRESSTGSQAREGLVAPAVDSGLEVGLEASVDYASPKDGLKALSMELDPADESESHDYISLELHFDEHVKKLGFEIVWEAEWPCVGSVVPGGEAERVGLVSGAVLTDMNGVSTLGKSRDELMPLLKVRPLQLNAQVPASHVLDSQ